MVPGLFTQSIILAFNRWGRRIGVDIAWLTPGATAAIAHRLLCNSDLRNLRLVGKCDRYNLATRELNNFAFLRQAQYSKHYCNIEFR